jgi:hypothetical protein
MEVGDTLDGLGAIMAALALARERALATLDLPESLFLGDVDWEASCRPRAWQAF